MDPSGQRPAGPSAPRTRLDSWKAVAAYLRREINSVQRWERSEGLPIHRLVPGRGGSIFAFTDEIDAWRQLRTAAAGRRSARAPRTPDAGAPGQVDDAPAIAAGPERRQPRPVTADDVRPDVPGSARAVAARPPGHRRLAAGLAVAVVVAALLSGGSRPHLAHRPPAVRRPIGRVAVLPLRDLSPQPGEEYVADGMTDALIARLATTTNLKVTSRTSVMAFKAQRATLPQIAEALGVDAILEGSVTRVGDHVRIIATLVDARADAQLWSGRFERPFEDALVLEGEIAGAVAQAVRATLQQPVGRARVDREVSAESYRHYLKGRVLLDTNTMASIREALQEFDAALAVDPTFALAYAGLASAHEDLSNTMLGAPLGTSGSDRSVAAARRALELDPGLAEAHSALARGLMGQLKWTEAEASFRRALELNPSDARTHLWFGEWLAVRGQPKDVLDAARHAMALDPLSVRTMAAGGFLLGHAGARDEASAAFRAAVALRPEYVQAQFLFGVHLASRPETLGEAIEHVEAAARLGGRAPGIVARLSEMYLRAGRRQARALAGEVLHRQASEWVTPTATAIAHLTLGDRDQALRDLERAVHERSRGAHLLPVVDGYNDLKDDARYQALMRRITND